MGDEAIIALDQSPSILLANACVSHEHIRAQGAPPHPGERAQSERSEPSTPSALVLKCEHCGGRLRIEEIATKPDDVSRVLGARGWARAPPRAPPEVELQALAHGPLRLEVG